jgi:hypothetical protein
MSPGATYSVVGYAVSGSAESLASEAVTAIAGVPTVRPGKPRIDGIKATPGRRLAVAVSRIDPEGWTSTFVLCSDGVRSYRADVLDGKAVLTVPSGATYRCYAKSANDVGATRSRPVRIDL